MFFLWDVSEPTDTLTITLKLDVGEFLAVYLKAFVAFSL